MTKPTKWPVRPAKTQISLSIHPVWSVFAVRIKKHWALNYLWAYSEVSDQTRQMPRLTRVFAGRTCHFVGFVVQRLNYKTLCKNQIVNMREEFHVPDIHQSMNVLSSAMLTCRLSDVIYFWGFILLSHMPYLTLWDKISQNLAHLEADSQKIFRSHRIFRPSYNTFYEDISINHTLLCLSQTSYIIIKAFDYFWGASKWFL